MNALAFEILPSPSSNDHEVRIRIDGEDWLGKDYMCIDPPVFFAQKSLTEGGELLVGRCNCGCEGCDDVWVNSVKADKEVLWTNAKGLRLHFDREAYDKLICSASQDFSWEDTNRTAERLVSKVFQGILLDGGYSFAWASARVETGMMALSFNKSGKQQLLKFAWNGQKPEQALLDAKRFKEETFS